MKVFFSAAFESKGQQFSGQNGLYASVHPVYGTRELWSRLTDTFKRFEVTPEPEDELHVTLMYSKDMAPDQHQLEAMHEEPMHSIYARPKNIEYWDGHDGDGYVGCCTLIVLILATAICNIVKSVASIALTTTCHT